MNLTHLYVCTRFDWSKEKEGTDSGTLREREQWLAPLCVEHSFRMSDRLHIHLFGDTRGT